MPFDEVFQPLKFRNLTVKNRVFRSNVSGRFDNFEAQIMSVFNPLPFV